MSIWCISVFPPLTYNGEALAAAGGGGGGATGAMAPPLAHEGGAILSFDPTFDMKGKR